MGSKQPTRPTPEEQAAFRGVRPPPPPPMGRGVFPVAPDPWTLVGARFVPDDQGGHILFNGKIWRPEAVRGNI